MKCTSAVPRAKKQQAALWTALFRLVERCRQERFREFHLLTRMPSAAAVRKSGVQSLESDAAKKESYLRFEDVSIINSRFRG